MRRTLQRWAPVPLVVLGLVGLSTALPQDTQEPKPATFAPAEAAEAKIKKALHLAAKKNRRVLLVWGREDKPDDLALFQTVRGGRTKDWPFYYEFVITAVDRRGTEALARTYGVGEDEALTVLDSEGKVLGHGKPTWFRGEDGWQANKVALFLKPHIAEPQDAEVLLKEALQEAGKKDQRLFVHLGAPW